MRAAWLAIPLLLAISGPIEAGHKKHRRHDYGVHVYIDLGPRSGGGFYFGARPHSYYGSGYRYDHGYKPKKHRKYEKKLRKKYMKKLKKLRKHHRRHHDRRRPYRRH